MSRNGQITIDNDFASVARKPHQMGKRGVVKTKEKGLPRDRDNKTPKRTKKSKVPKKSTIVEEEIEAEHGSDDEETQEQEEESYVSQR